MNIKRKLSFSLMMTLILQLLWIPTDIFGATNNYNASISQVTRESSIVVEEGSTKDIEFTLHGPSEAYEPSLRQISLVLDVSGSMKDSMGRASKMEVLKKSAHRLIDKFTGDNVEISLTQYSNSGDSTSRFYSMKNSSDVNQLKGLISNMSPNGATNIGDGMRRGYYQLENSSKENASKYIIVMTDGVPQGFTMDGNNNYKLTDGDTGVSQNSDFRNNRDFFIYAGKDNITILAETADENHRTYSLDYAKQIGNKINNSEEISPFFIGFSNDANLEYLNQIAESSNAEVVESNRRYYDAKSQDELNSVFDSITQKMKDEYAFQSVVYEEIIPEGVNVKNLPEGFSFDVSKRKISGNINVSMVKNPQTNQYDLVFEPFTVEYQFLKSGKYLFDKATLKYTDPFDHSKQSKVTDMQAIVKEAYPKISIEARDGDRVVDSSPFETDSSAPSKQTRILDSAEKLKAKEGATATINITGRDLVSSKYAFITDPEDKNIQWIDLDLASSINIVNPPDMLDIEGLKSRYYDVSHLPLLSGDAQWSSRAEVYKSPNDEIKIRSGFLEPEGNSYAQIQDHLFFGHVGAEGVDYKEAAKFWGYIVPDETGDFYFAIQSDDGNYGYIIVNGQKIEISNYFRPTSPMLTFTNNKVSLKKGVAYPIYMEYFNWGGEGEFQIFMKDTPWNANLNNKEIEQMYGIGILKKAYQSQYRVPSNWFRATSNDTPGLDPEATFEASKTVRFPGESGKYYIAAKSENKSGKTREVIYGPFIVDKTPPEITLIGDNPLEISVGTVFKDPGATAKDYDYELEEYVEIKEIKVEHDVDTSQVGTYTVTYTAEDEFGNKAIQTRDVKVVGGLTLDPDILYIKKGDTGQLTATVDPVNHILEWSNENSSIVSLENGISNIEGEEIKKVTGLEVGSSKVKVKDKDITEKEVSDTSKVYVYDYEPSNDYDVLVGTELQLTDIPAGMDVNYEVITTNKKNGSDPEPVRYDGNKVIAQSVGSATINVTIQGEDGKDLKDEVTKAPVVISYTVNVFNVEIISAEPTDKPTYYGYINPDVASFILNFKVETPTGKQLDASTLEMVPTFDTVDIGLDSSSPIKEKLFMAGNTNMSTSLGASGYDGATNTFSIDFSELNDGTYKMILTVNLKPGNNLTVETYKGYIGNNIPVKNTLKVLGDSVSLGTTVDGEIEVPIINSPNIK